MKKALRFTVIILTLFFSCSESENDELLNDTSIIYQEGNIVITLIDINDSRCPLNSNCIWQGNAEVAMRITNGEETMDFTLNTAGDINENYNFPSSTSIFDVTIKLLDLQPYPESDNQDTLEDYSVNIEVY